MEKRSEYAVFSNDRNGNDRVEQLRAAQFTAYSPNSNYSKPQSNQLTDTIAHLR
jgi:hypothetical protein